MWHEISGSVVPMPPAGASHRFRIRDFERPERGYGDTGKTMWHEISGSVVPMPPQRQRRPVIMAAAPRLQRAGGEKEHGPKRTNHTARILQCRRLISGGGGQAPGMQTARRASALSHPLPLLPLDRALP